MSQLLGRPQDILVGVPQILRWRATVDGAAATIAASPAPTVESVTKPDGTTVAITESPTLSSPTLSLARTWVAAVTPANLLLTHKIIWGYTVGSSRYYGTQRFFLIDEPWDSQVIEADITGIDPQIKQMVGNTALSTWIQEAWGDLWDLIWSLTHRHPASWSPDYFRQAHIEQTKYRLYADSITRKPDDRWETLAGMHKAQAEQLVRAIVQNPNIAPRGGDSGVVHLHERELGFW
jgi:hypothetical protein